MTSTSNTGFLTTSELDFNTLKTSFKTFLKGQEKYRDYDFEASNLNILMELLAYNTYIQAYNLNQVGSEMFLDTAQMKESAVSHAKELNYVPRSRTSSSAKVVFNIFPGDLPDFITIPKNYAVTTTVDSKTLFFVTQEDVIVRRDSNNQYISPETILKEGSFVVERFTAVTGKVYILQSRNIDSMSITVKVNGILYSLAENLFGVNKNSKIYFIQGHSANQYEVVFGKGQFGVLLVNGDQIEIVYRDTLGEGGNGAFSFKKTSSISGYTNITITTINAARFGAERESLDQIKFNAPRFFPTKGVAVTGMDFQSLAIKQFPQIESVIAFGGEQLENKIYGSVVLAVKAQGADTISDDLRLNIKNYLETKTLTTEVLVIDPEYFFISIISSIYYDAVNLSINTGQLKTDIDIAIVKYGTLFLNKFGNDFRYSSLLSYIDGVSPSITSNETDIKILYKWTPERNVRQRFSFSFDNPITSLQSTLFSYRHQGITYKSAILEADSLGNISVFEFLSTTVKSVIDSNIGVVDFATGVVSLIVEIADYNRSLNFITTLRNKDFICKRNKILSIDIETLSTEVKKVRE